MPNGRPLPLWPARRLAARGYPLIVVGRRQQRLDALAAEFSAVNIRPVVTDLASAAGLAARSL